MRIAIRTSASKATVSSGLMDSGGSSPEQRETYQSRRASHKSFPDHRRGVPCSVRNVGTTSDSLIKLRRLIDVTSIVREGQKRYRWSIPFNHATRRMSDKDRNAKIHDGDDGCRSRSRRNAKSSPRTQRARRLWYLPTTCQSTQHPAGIPATTALLAGYDIASHEKVHLLLSIKSLSRC